jgi:hypothetical protein
MNIFISYAPENEDLARDLASRLTEAGQQVWYSGGRVLPGDNAASEIGSALESSDAMIVLVTPESMRSEWVRQEINFALGSSKYAGRVIPVLVKPTDEIPWILQKLKSVRAVKNRGEVSRQILTQLQQCEA